VGESDRDKGRRCRQERRDRTTERGEKKEKGRRGKKRQGERVELEIGKEKEGGERVSERVKLIGERGCKFKEGSSVVHSV
jgi:hypothetical protein